MLATAKTAEEVEKMATNLTEKKKYPYNNNNTEFKNNNQNSNKQFFSGYKSGFKNKRFNNNYN